MASWLPYKIQKRLLRYALSRTGILDDTALDLENLDITLGKRNVVELKDVGLNIKHISKLAQLPPSLRIETARVLSLRLTVPADIYQSSIVVEVDGIELSVALVGDEGVQDDGTKQSHRRQHGGAQSPSHRKTNRRIHSPAPNARTRLSTSDEDLRIPTTQDLARSFLFEEPAAERKELEASVTGRKLEDSISSSSDGEVGTGAALGVPTFLADFLQGIVDRIQVDIKNVCATVEAQIPSDLSGKAPVVLQLKVKNGKLAPVVSGGDSLAKREFRLAGISLELIVDADTFSEASQSHSPSPAPSKTERQTVDQEIIANSVSMGVSTSESHNELAEELTSRASLQTNTSRPGSAGILQASTLTADADRFADAGDAVDNGNLGSSNYVDSELDIRPGDDNLSWGSRRSHTSAPADDLWNSMAGEDELPDSLLLEAERATTPKPTSSRSVSPVADRSRRAVSPYDRGFQSPGSWPRFDESTSRRAPQQSPGSWPALDQSQHSLYQPMTPGPGPLDDQNIDNKRLGFEASSHSSHESSPLPSPGIESPPDEMLESRFYTHEEAQSMYMSAMTHDSHDVQPFMPGGWSSEGERSEPSEPGVQPDPSSQLTPGEPGLEPALEQAGPNSGAATPRAHSRSSAPVMHPPTPPNAGKTSKQLLHCDTVSIFFPSKQDDEDMEASTQQPAVVKTPVVSRGMPGTFSAYSEMAASRRRLNTSESDSGSMVWASPQTSSAPRKITTEIQIGEIAGQIDLATAQLLYKAAAETARRFPQSDGTPSKDRASAGKAPAQGSVKLSIQTVNFYIRDQIEEFVALKSQVIQPLAALTLREIRALSRPAEHHLSFGQIAFWVGNAPLLSIGERSASSGAMTTDPSVELTLSSGRALGQNQQISAIRVRSVPVFLDIDLRAIDEVMGSFGGLSGILELGNSMLSEGVVPTSPVARTSSAKGVRFADSHGNGEKGAEVMANARVDGLSINLHGESCAVEMQTSTIRAIYGTERGVSVATPKIHLKGPYTAQSSEVPLSLTLSMSRLDYHSAPQDKDLERLIALLTPTKDKYDNDDDIILDTLLRQRKKGACLRFGAEELSLDVLDLSSLFILESLGTELAKLSAVTKYLPEDDRPGPMILIRLNNIQAKLPVNDKFGQLCVAAQDFHCAHVGLPALLALQLSNLSVARTDGSELVHSLIPLFGADNLPMIMARVLGGEVEPTIKVKVYNVCVEYTAATLLDLTSVGEEANMEEIVSELAISIAELAAPSEWQQKSPRVGDESPKLPVKKTNVEILLHNSAIGLSPQKATSKGLVVLTDAHLSTAVLPGDVVVAKAEFRKAAILVTDNAFPNEDEMPAAVCTAYSNTTTDPRLATALFNRGYAPIASIMSARIVVNVQDVTGDGSKSIEVDVRNELLLLETCADSTQTFIAVFSSLAPPSPPSKQPKYLTEPMSVEDMISSLSGEAFTKPERSKQTLFDVDEESEANPEDLLNATDFGEEQDDLLTQSEMTSSLYGPGSGILGLDDDDGGPDQDYGETVQSLLEADGFEMTDAPTDMPFRDSELRRHLKQQSRLAVVNENVDIGISELEIDDLGFEALDAPGDVLSNRDHFALPASRRKLIGKVASKQPLPFKLRLRDVHVIWNLYDGYDWQKTRDGITEAVEQVEMRSEERKARRRQSRNDPEDDESVIGDFLFNSIYIGVPSNQDAQDIRRQINRHIDDLASETESVPMSGMSRPTAYSASGRPLRQQHRRRLKLERSKSHKIAFELKGISADVLVFSPEPGKDDEVVQSSVDVRIHSFEIFDNVPTSTWKKFLTTQGDPNLREMHKPMAHLDVMTVKTKDSLAATELLIKVSLLPLRLHVDQDALDFMTRFFEFKDESMAPPDVPSEPPFIQRLEIDTVHLQLDYKPKKIDYAGIRSGRTAEFMNIVILDAANIRLQRAIVLGLRGFEPLHDTLNGIWMPDVTRNQLPTVLAGLAPVRSLVNIGSGIRDIYSIPMREYTRDGRILRSIQKGAFQSSKNAVSEMARFGAKLALGTHNILQGAEGFLAPGAAHDQGLDDGGREQRAISSYADQPVGVFSGLRDARRHLQRDLMTAKDALIAVQGEFLESRGPGSAAAAVARHAPTVILRPVIGASRAVGTALLGVGNQIDKDHLRKMEDKYKRH